MRRSKANAFLKFGLKYFRSCLVIYYSFIKYSKNLSPILETKKKDGMTKREKEPLEVPKVEEERSCAEGKWQRPAFEMHMCSSLEILLFENSCLAYGVCRKPTRKD